MMRIIFLFLIVSFATQFAEAQQFGANVEPTVESGAKLPAKLGVERDATLDKMLDWHIKKNTDKSGMDGFRVEIFFSSKLDAKQEALKTKVNFLSKYPDYPVHIKFIAPNFRVRVGDFRTKNEAWKLFKQIQNEYPTAFVVPDRINFPLLKENQYE